jgi:hypothetical protein
MVSIISAIFMIALVHAKPGKFTVIWDCPHTELPPEAGAKWGPDMPRYKEITFTADPNKEKSVKSTDLTELVSIAKASGVDYDDCLLHLYSLVRGKIAGACIDALPGSKPGKPHPYDDASFECESNGASAAENFRAEVASVAPKPVSLPRVLPMDPVIIHAEKTQRARIAQVFKDIEKRVLDTKPRNCNLLYDSPPDPRDRNLITSFEFMNDVLPRIMKKLEAEKADFNKAADAQYCEGVLGKTYLSYMASLPRPEAQCPSTSPKCLVLRKRSAELFRILKSTFPASNTEIATVFDNAATCALLGVDPAPYIYEMGRHLDQAMSCVSPEPGEAPAIVDQTNGGLKPKYTLKRKLPEKPANYEIGFNLHFEPAAKDAAMRAKVTECLAYANQHLKQKNGETLEIKLTDEPLTVRQTVKVGNQRERVDAEFWADQTTSSAPVGASGQPGDLCKTNIHEILHLLGLPDEYPETEKGYDIDQATMKATWKDKVACYGKDDCKFGWDCRILGPKDSIMRDMDAAFTRVKDKKEPLLYPAEWRVLTHPGCKSVNGPSYACMDMFQRTTVEAGGTGCGVPPPKSCKSATDTDIGWMKDPMGEIVW